MSDAARMRARVARCDRARLKRAHLRKTKERRDFQLRVQTRRLPTTEENAAAGVLREGRGNGKWACCAPFMFGASDGLNGAGGGGGGVGGTPHPPQPGTHLALPEATLRHPLITPVPAFISVKTLSVRHQQCWLVADHSHTEQPSEGAPVQVASQASAVGKVPAK